MKDLIGNVLGVGDRVAVELPSARIMGFISEVRETSVLATRQQATQAPGHILVSCVFALPVDVEHNAVPTVVKVYDPNKPLGATEPPPSDSGGVALVKPN